MTRVYVSKPNSGATVLLWIKTPNQDWTSIRADGQVTCHDDGFGFLAKAIWEPDWITLDVEEP